MKNEQHSLLMNELKNILKTRGIHYSQLAQALKISESSMKRIMNASDGNISRIEEICNFLDISFSDLVVSCNANQKKEFLIEGELFKFFCENITYFNFFSALHEHDYDLEKLLLIHPLTKRSIRKYLKQLEKLKLIEVHAGDRIKSNVRGGLTIQEKGKLNHHLVSVTLKNLEGYIKFPDTLKRDSGDKEPFVNMGDGYLTNESGEAFLREFKDLANRIQITSERERSLHRKSELTMFSWFDGLLPLRLYRAKISEV